MLRPCLSFISRPIKCKTNQSKGNVVHSQKRISKSFKSEIKDTHNSWYAINTIQQQYTLKSRLLGEET